MSATPADQRQRQVKRRPQPDRRCSHNAQVMRGVPTQLIADLGWHGRDLRLVDARLADWHDYPHSLHSDRRRRAWRGVSAAACEGKGDAG